MHPREISQINNSTHERTIRYIGFAFAGLAFVLVAVCTISFIAARQVKQNYSLVVLNALNKLELVNELHHNDNEVQNLLMTYISSEDAAEKTKLRDAVQQAHQENTTAIYQLDKLLQSRERKDLLQNITQERRRYYIIADSLLLLSNESPERAKAYAQAYLLPAHKRHQQYLQSLSKQIQETPVIQANKVVSSINASVDKYTLLLLIALVLAAGAAYIIGLVFRKLKQENINLNAEIKERSKLEHALSEQKREYKMLFNRNPMPMWVYDRVTLSILEANKAAELEYGYSQAEFLKMTVKDLRPEEEVENLLSNLNDSDETAVSVPTKFLHKRRDGSLFRVEIRSHALPNKGALKPRLVLSENIDEREKALEKLQRNEEQLKRNEANLRALLDSSSQAVFLLDEALNVLSFNKEAEADVRRYLLKKLEPGQSMLEYISSNKKEKTIAHHARAMQGEKVSFETGHGEFWHEISYQPVTSEENQILAVALTIRNVSDNKRALETIKRNELQLARAQQLAKLGSWEYHVKQSLLTWSDGTFAVYRKDKATFAPSLHNMLAIIHPEDRGKVKANYHEAITTKSMLNFEHRIILPDGKEANVLEVAEVSCDEDGEVIKLWGTVQDITERKKAEQEVTEAKNLLQTTIENIPEIIFTIDADLNIIYISPQCKQITGYPEEAFLGDPNTWLKVIYPDDKKALMQEVLPQVLSGKPYEYEMRLVDSSGKVRWLLLRISPGLDHERKVMRMYGSASDMTAYKEAEAKQQELSDQLIQQNQNLQQFAYIVSHNLRGPIANMLGLTSIYDRNRFDAPINRRVIDNMVKSAQLLDATIRDLNDILTIRNQISSIKETIAFDCLLQNVLEILNTEITACGASISFDFQDAPQISSVRSYAQSILLNLLSNALKYRFPDRKLNIRINTFRLNNYICLCVHDNGLGIDLEKQQDKIFGLYKRFHQGVEGKGLGLHLVKTQVELLGGKVEVQSKLHEGSTFNVYFKS